MLAAEITGNCGGFDYKKYQIKRSVFRGMPSLEMSDNQDPESDGLHLNHVQSSRLGQVLTDDVCRRLGIFAIPDGFRLSVVIPVFNEVNTVLDVVERVRRTELPMEIILVDDGSEDGTREKLETLKTADDIRVILHEKNRGKGAALRTGFEHATGDAVVVQDADLEYDPDDFRFLIQPIVEGTADVVYGTRYGHHDRQVPPLWHVFVNRWISRLCNLRTGLYLSDVETCYKVIRRELIQELAPGLRENRFGIEIEMTIKLARKKVRFYERPIRYDRRGFDEGKKIGWRDGVRALYCMLRY
ncbi:MAG: glycosyltransferase family 2 protein [Aureliella sp.]